MDTKEIVERLENPHGTLDERLKRLQKEFPARNVNMLLALDKDFTLEQAKKDYVELLERVEAFVLNGHSAEGLEKYFGKVETF